MPDHLPVHYNIYGEADRWDSKQNFLIFVIIAPVLAYLLFLAALYIDPKKKITEMEQKFHHLRFIIIALITSIFILMIYANINGLSNFKDYISIILGIVFILFGNYFRNLKPNYFIGIRTPWTLENDTVWKHTHRLGSIVWFAGGVLVVLINLSGIFKSLTWPISFSLIFLIILIPVMYSYTVYKKLKS